LRRWVVVHIQQVEAYVILVGSNAGKVKRLGAVEDGRRFKVVVSRLVGLDGQIAEEALQQLAQRDENRCEVRLGRLGGGGCLLFCWFGGGHNGGSIAQLARRQEQKRGAVCAAPRPIKSLNRDLRRDRGCHWAMISCTQPGHSFPRRLIPGSCNCHSGPPRQAMWRSARRG